MRERLPRFEALRPWRDDPAYWAAAVLTAERAGDTARAQEARQQLERLGYKVEPIKTKRQVNDGNTD